MTTNRACTSYNMLTISLLTELGLFTEINYSYYHSSYSQKHLTVLYQLEREVFIKDDITTGCTLIVMCQQNITDVKINMN